MASRPTIRDLADKAGVSVATVDRVLNRRHPVREGTAKRVYEAAQEIGYHATGLLKQRLAQAGESCRFGFVLQKQDHFYTTLAEALTEAVDQAAFVRGSARVEFVGELVPATIADSIRRMARQSDVVGVVAVDHPLVTEAVEEVTAAGVPVMALISPLTAPSVAGYAGLDNRKRGRAAAWLIARTARQPGKIGIFIGSHRYLNQETSEMSFRAWLREHAPELKLLEPLMTLDDQRVAYEAALNLIASNPDLVAIYVAGGGMGGVLNAVRDEKAGERLVVVCNELVPETRAALIDGTLDMAMATPMAELCRRAVEAMWAAVSRGAAGPDAKQNIALNTVLCVPENI